MRSLRGTGFARILNAAEMHTAESGNPVMLLTVEFEQRTLAKGTAYAQRVQFRSFAAEDHALVDSLRAGVLIAFDGDADAVAEKSPTGWWYANPRVTGRILTVIDPESGLRHG
jgi:hypothetical protein